MESNYWNTKLEKIQFAIQMLYDVKAGTDINLKIRKLEELESRAAQDLIEAEQEEAQRDE